MSAHCMSSPKCTERFTHKFAGQYFTAIMAKTTLNQTRPDVIYNKSVFHGSMIVGAGTEVQQF